MLTLTPAAAEALREIRETNELDEKAGLRVTARLDGDEVAIELDLVDGPEEGDEVVEQGGARVFLDPESSGLLTDVELDVEEHDDHVHFQFAPRSGDDGA
jgi:iron-sulfur cluster assembly protein